jgi:hypothetical protein
MIEVLLTFGLATTAGGFGALIGIGGGLIVVPVLSLVVGVPMKTAVATSLMAVIATSTAAAAPYIGRGIADRRLGLILLVSTVTGGVLGGLVGGLIDPLVLSAIFGVVLVLVSAETIRAEVRGTASRELDDLEAAGYTSSYFEPTVDSDVPFQAHRLKLGVLVSTLAGGMSGLLGVGGGVVNVPTMSILMGAPLRVATTTSTYMLGATAVASGVLYYARGDIDPFIAAPVVLGVLLGARVGARMAHRVPQETLRWAFAFIALVFAAQMFLRAAGVV